MYLEIAVVRENARTAYLAGKLQAQQAEVPPTCRYSQGCVIGQTYQPPIESGHDTSPVHTLIRDGLITTDDEQGLIRLQVLHDQWIKRRRQHRFVEAKQLEQNLRRELGIDQ